MRLDSLSISRVRNLSQVFLQPSVKVNVIYGDNAVGKTALLESIYLLSKARSFRTSRITDLIQHGHQEIMVTGAIRCDNSVLVKTGVRKAIQGTEIKYDSEQVKTVSQQARNVIVQAVVPDNTKLLTGSPKERRKWMDWAQFHVEHDYLKVWHSYYRALRSRNALLRRHASEKEFFVWENMMASSSKTLTNMWQGYLNRLQKYYQEIVTEFPCVNVEFSMKKDRIIAGSFLQYLQSNRQSDMKAGFTQQGLHKMDIEFRSRVKTESRTQSKDIKKIFSRGQIKLFVTLLAIAQSRLMQAEMGVIPIMLVDDLDSELDQKMVSMLLRLLCQQGNQLFITTIDPKNIVLDTVLRDEQHKALFHVKQGQVKKC